MSNDSWTFVYVTDMQPGSPKSYRFKPALLENWRTARKQIIDIKPEFFLIGGDITRDGTLHRWELEEMKADFDDMGIPYRAVAGNMDAGNKVTRVEGPRDNRKDTDIGITSQTLSQYESVFGSSKWTSVHRNVRVSGFCDMLLGSGLDEEKDLLDWLAQQESEPRADHHIWLMHYALFVNDVDETVFDIRKEEEYHSWYFTVQQDYRERLLELFSKTNAERVITGHIHCRKDFYAHGIHFDLAPGTGFSQWADHWQDGDPTLGFYRFDVDAEGLRRTFIPLERVSNRTDGYGPGGHPTPEMRDYSLAWEK